VALLSHGAEPRPVNTRSQTPLRLAVDKQHTQVIYVLVSHLLGERLAEYDGRSGPWAARAMQQDVLSERNSKMTRMLMECQKNADVLVGEVQGLRHVTVQLLLEAGADAASGRRNQSLFELCLHASATHSAGPRLNFGARLCIPSNQAELGHDCANLMNSTAHPPADALGGPLACTADGTVMAVVGQDKATGGSHTLKATSALIEEIPQTGQLPAGDTAPCRSSSEEAAVSAGKKDAQWPCPATRKELHSMMAQDTAMSVSSSRILQPRAFRGDGDAPIASLAPSPGCSIHGTNEVEGETISANLGLAHSVGEAIADRWRGGPGLLLGESEPKRQLRALLEKLQVCTMHMHAAMCHCGACGEQALVYSNLPTLACQRDYQASIP
jgi:hypothetical protein